MSLLVWIGIGLVGILALFLIVQFNKLIGLRLRIGESWANVDTELKRRHDLVPNLVETVRGYAKHERDLFARVASLRGQVQADSKDTRRRLAQERDLALALGRVLAVAEAYPQLRASDSFLRLQGQLVETEDRIQAARRFYNGNVRDYNNQVQQVPSNVVAWTFRFRAHEYFELPSLAERVAPSVRV